MTEPWWKTAEREERIRQAAPEMLEALLEVAHEHDYWREEDGYDVPSWLTKVRVAIQKAKGESP